MPATAKASSTSQPPPPFGYSASARNATAVERLRAAAVLINRAAWSGVGDPVGSARVGVSVSASAVGLRLNAGCAGVAVGRWPPDGLSQPGVAKRVLVGQGVASPAPDAGVAVPEACDPDGGLISPAVGELDSGWG